MKDRISVSSKKLTIKVDEEYLYCTAEGELEFKVSIDLIFNIIKYVYNMNWVIKVFEGLPKFLRVFREGLNDF